MSLDHNLNLSFSSRRVNRTTFVIREDDAYGEQPLIYVRVCTEAPVIVVCDTGCDQPRHGNKSDKYINLRTYLEQIPLSCNQNRPLNPDGRKSYLIICTHCHYDHTGGIEQFLDDEATEIVASAAGRDFIESDLQQHGLFDLVGMKVPSYHVTKWAMAFERLHWPFQHTRSSDRDYSPGAQNLSTCDSCVQKPTDLNITIIHTPGHTPDELAWYDHQAMHLYVGDSFYQRDNADVAIIWPNEGNLIEWSYSMEKLRRLVASENARAAQRNVVESLEDDDWVVLTQRVLVSCGHETVSVDAETILRELDEFWQKVLRGKLTASESFAWRGEINDVWIDDANGANLKFRIPRPLMKDAREFFGISNVSPIDSNGSQYVII